MHLKRQKVPKNWPVHRKGTKYVVRPGFNLKTGIPILVVLRDILCIAKNKKEAKSAIQSKHILINNKFAKDEKNSMLLFDVLNITPSKEYYRLELSKKGKFIINEIKESESKKKLSKVINKKTLKGKKMQLNLIDGRNIISEVKCNVNDSVLIDFKSKKIEKCLPLKENSKIIIFSGKHSGETGVIKKIDMEKKVCGLTVDGKQVDALIKQFMVTE